MDAKFVKVQKKLIMSKVFFGDIVSVKIDKLFNKFRVSLYHYSAYLV